MAKKKPTPKPTIRKKPGSRAAASNDAVASFVSGSKRKGPGRPPSSVEREQQTLYLDAEIRKKLKLRAVSDGREISEIVEAALAKYL